MENKLNELNKILTKESDKECIRFCTFLFPNDWEIIKEMILGGLEPETIKEICNICYKSSLGNKTGWRFAKTPLVGRFKNERIKI